MWQVDNRTSFAADRAWVRDRDGSEVWLVAVKATFSINPDGSTEVAEEQPPVLRVPEHYGESGENSVKYDADLILKKRTTDVIVVGHAYAPNDRPATRIDVGLRVGSIQKILRVVGDRIRESHGGLSDPLPFVKMPVVYERAYGGRDRRSTMPDRDFEWRNPVGVGFAISERNAQNLPAPNIEYPSGGIGAWNARPAPAGFGAIASHWQDRASLAGTYDDQWMKTRQPLLPEDCDDRFFQCAPVDQQAEAFLRGGEPVALYGLSPRGTLRFRLPRISLGFETRFFDGSREIHKNRSLHTVILEPDFPRVSLVWHTALRCHFKVLKLDRTIVTQKLRLQVDGRTIDDVELQR